MTPKQIILSRIVDYFKKINYKHQSMGKVINFLCPFCNEMSAQVINGTHLMKCHNPACPRAEKTNPKFTLISIVKKIEEDKKDWDSEKIVDYLKEKLAVNVFSEKDKQEIVEQFNKYQSWGFSLVPIQKNGKKPIETKWTEKEHKNPSEWIEWLNNGLNFGVRTGKVSDLTIIDIDTKPIPKEIEALMGAVLIQESTKGFHLYYKYIADFPKTGIEINGEHIDIENEGGQVVIAPSKIKGIKRKFINDNGIIEIPKELKNYLLKYVTKIKTQKTYSEKFREDVEDDSYKKPLISEGDGRSELFIRIGGKIRKFLPYNQTRKVLKVLDKTICTDELGKELDTTILSSIEKYTIYDEDEIANQIMQYLKEAGEADKRDIEKVILGNNITGGEEQAKLGRALAYLIREEKVRKQGRFYLPINKIEWKTSLLEGVMEIPFKVPYFNDLAYFNYGDVVIIGGVPGCGKTHVAMNIIKQLVDQKITPSYISLESGSRFKKVALELGLVEGDFRYSPVCIDPTQVELENNDVTIIDWLLPKQYKNTDKIIGHFNQQLDKHGGFIFLFVQLRKSNQDWFAKDLIEFFPALAVKYLWDDEGGEFTHFEICKVRESQKRKRLGDIPCKFIWETKELKRIDKIESLPEPVETEQELEGNNEEINEPIKGTLKTPLVGEEIKKAGRPKGSKNKGK